MKGKEAMNEYEKSLNEGIDLVTKALQWMAEDLSRPEVVSLMRQLIAHDQEQQQEEWLRLGYDDPAVLQAAKEEAWREHANK